MFMLNPLGRSRSICFAFLIQMMLSVSFVCESTPGPVSNVVRLHFFHRQAGGMKSKVGSDSELSL